MPSSKRDLIKRKHVAISNALTRALGWTIELSCQFEKPHPEYSLGYDSIGVMIDQARASIDKMKEYI